MVGLTDTGKMRPDNEDSIVIYPEAGLAVLADGMGGHQAGEVASKLAVESIARHVIDGFSNIPHDAGDSFETKIVSEAIQAANSAIYEFAHTRPEYAGMGSTVVAVVFYENKLCVGHVGDSRLYRYRQGMLEKMTLDHSVIQELVSRGLVTEEEARQSIGKNLVTRALGVDPVVTADISEQTLLPEDIYLLCSDGLNDVLADGDIEMMLMEYGRNLETAARRMIDTANGRGGPDNISVILARAGKEFVRDPEILEKLQESLNRV